MFCLCSSLCESSPVCTVVFSARRKRQSTLAAGHLQEWGGVAEEGAGKDLPHRGGPHPRAAAALSAADHAEHAAGNTPRL